MHSYLGGYRLGYQFYVFNDVVNLTIIESLMRIRKMRNIKYILVILLVILTIYTNIFNKL